MRQPLEDRIISISRAKYSTEYPASSMLVASMNPCPCGYYGHPKKKCVCNEYQRTHYMSKISRPRHRRLRRDLKQLISLRFLMASAHGACADVFDHHIIARLQPHRNLDCRAMWVIIFNIGLTIYFLTVFLSHSVTSFRTSGDIVSWIAP